MDKIKILFLAADPSNASRLRLGQELRDVRERLQLAKHRDKFILESRESVRPGDISQAIFDIDPQIVHFSGHGLSTGELCFEDLSGNLQPIKQDALAALFELVANKIECVVLNACYSDVQAQAISDYIPFVIGMNKAIGDRAAIAFSTGFYKALGAKRSFEEAYKFGCVEIKLQNIQEDLIPVLISRSKNTHSGSNTLFSPAQSYLMKKELSNKLFSTKYYVYTSKTKVDMLFYQWQTSQVDKENFQDISSNEYSKLSSVIHRLNDEGVVGSLESSLPYASMELRMKWASLGWSDDSPITFWGYASKNRIFALAGSKHHLLGHSGEGRAHSHSLTGVITKWLLEQFSESVEQRTSDVSECQNISDYDIANSIYLSVTQMTGQENNFDFLAKILHRSYWKNGFRNSGFKEIVLATPLYVSLEE